MSRDQRKKQSKQKVNCRRTKKMSVMIGGTLLLALSQSSLGQRDNNVNQPSSLRSSSSTVLRLDVNADGREDLVLADPGALGEIGQVSVYFGANGRNAVAKGNPDLIIKDESVFVVNLGAHLSFERDYNKDGYKDLVVSGWQQTEVDVYAPIAAVWDLHQRKLIGWIDTEIMAGIQKRQQLDLNKNGVIDPDDLTRGIAGATRAQATNGQSPSLDTGKFVYEVMTRMHASVIDPPGLNPGSDCWPCARPWEGGDEIDPGGGGDIDHGGGTDGDESEGGNGGNPGEILVDCDGDGVPETSVPEDDAAQDCDGDGIPDICEIEDGAADCNNDGIPDECQEELDCDLDGIPDECQGFEIGGDVDVIAIGWGDVGGILSTEQFESTEDDCDGNGIRDSCELDGNDCNNNGVHDACETNEGNDCDDDGVPDECEEDSDENGIPDDCECDEECLEGPSYMGDKDNVWIDFICPGDCGEIEWELVGGEDLLDFHQAVPNPMTGNCAYWIQALEDVSGAVTVEATGPDGCVNSWTVTVQTYCQGEFTYRVGIPWNGLGVQSLAHHPLPEFLDPFLGILSSILHNGYYAVGLRGDGPGLATDRMLVKSNIAANGWFDFTLLANVNNANGQHYFAPSQFGFGSLPLVGGAIGQGIPFYSVPFEPATTLAGGVNPACLSPASSLPFPAHPPIAVTPSTANTDVTLVAGPTVSGHLNVGVITRSATFKFKLHGSPFNSPNLTINAGAVPLFIPYPGFTNPVTGTYYPPGVLDLSFSWNAIDIGPIPAIDGNIEIEITQSCDPDNGMLPAVYMLQGGHDGFPAHRVFMTGLPAPIYSFMPASPAEADKLFGSPSGDITAGPVAGPVQGTAGTCP